MNKKRFLWCVKIGCLFLLVGGLIFNGPLLFAYKRAVAENLERGLKPRPRVVTARSYVSGRVASVEVPQYSLSAKIDDGDVIVGKLDCLNYGVPTNNSKLIDNQSGNFVVGSFGPSELFRLADLAPGTLAQVKLDNGQLFEYKFRAAITDTDGGVVAPEHSPPMLTLQRCKGSSTESLVFDLVEAK